MWNINNTFAFRPPQMVFGILKIQMELPMFRLLQGPFHYETDVMIFIYSILCISDAEGSLSS